MRRIHCQESFSGDAGKFLGEPQTTRTLCLTKNYLGVVLLITGGGFHLPTSASDFGT